VVYLTFSHLLNTTTIGSSALDISDHVGGIVLGCAHFQFDMLDGHVDHNAGVLERERASNLPNNG